ncbi:MAG: DUF3857 domain-containing protein [Candidatus Omnitrophica bacterium]|nr:DUF3857 domain-containing protein [Candidatus Omnitrophota bacterium]
MNYTQLDFNDEFVKAFEVLENTSQHVFITGKAGTGKSTLLQYFRQKTTKNVAVLAPTGVAAINVKGQTIHSFFQFKPDVTPQTATNVPVRRGRRKMYEELDAVIIDEVSMVRADLMDCVDVFLRVWGPHHDRPFGGVQMIFFGDLFQLPPVVAFGQEDIFKNHYSTPYFFSAKVFEGLDFKMMQLSKIYRQKDEHFIRLLNAVRDDNVEEHHWHALNQRFKPYHQLPKEDFYIVLTTTNALAERVNSDRLKNLPGDLKTYQGIVSGEFDKKFLPTPEELDIKPQAQVMMLNNDPEKRWVNGSLGKVVSIFSDVEGEDVVLVKLENGEVVDVKKHTWEIYQYYFDEENNSLASKVKGYFTQYPLKLAWAVTIHKSQGQTFERVIIDVGAGTFSHGQMYVALSRCTSLEGIVLKQPLTRRHILMDERVLQFMKKFIFLLTYLFCCSSVFAQTPPPNRDFLIAEDLSKIESLREKPGMWEENLKDNPYIGLLAQTTTVVHDDFSFDEDYHARVKVQKEGVKNLGKWPVYYNKLREEITDIKAYVQTPDGKKLEAGDIQDVPAFEASPLYSDMRIKVISLPEVRVGVIIDVRVKTRVFKEEMPGQFWDEVAFPSIPTKHAEFIYQFPETLPIHFSAFNNETKPVIEKANGFVKYSFIFDNTTYCENESFMPPQEMTTGVLSLSSISDWKQVADWWRDVMNKNTIDDDNIKAKVQDLIKDKGSPQDRIRAILEFIQDNFRYVSMNPGDHTVLVHPTNQIFQNRYGDTKDLAVLTRQMLKIAGFETNICLFSGEFNGDPRHKLPSPSVFDRVILETTLDNKEYFFETQAKGFDLGELPSSYDGAYVLVITSLDYHFANLPVANEFFHAVVSTSDIKLTDDGSADFHVNVKMPLEASQDFKSSWDPKDDASKEKFFDKLQATFGQGGKITDHEVKGLEKRYGPLEFDFKYGASRIYQVANDMILLREQDQGNVPDFSESTRQYSIFIPSNSMVINRNTYHIPDTLTLGSVPEDYHLETSFMAVSTKYTKGVDTITVESIYHLKRTTILLNSFADVRKFRNELDTKSQQYIILKKKTNISQQAQTWIKNQ